MKNDIILYTAGVEESPCLHVAMPVVPPDVLYLNRQMGQASTEFLSAPWITQASHDACMILLQSGLRHSGDVFLPIFTVRRRGALNGWFGAIAVNTDDTKSFSLFVL